MLVPRIICKSSHGTLRATKHPASTRRIFTCHRRLLNFLAKCARIRGLTNSSIRPRVIVVANPKGGVGKTTVAINLAMGLTLVDKRILFISINPSDGPRDLDASTKSCEFHEYVIVDTPFNLDPVPNNLFKLADVVLIPTTTSPFSIHGVFSVANRVAEDCFGVIHPHCRILFVKVRESEEERISSAQHSLGSTADRILKTRIRWSPTEKSVQPRDHSPLVLRIRDEHAGSDYRAFVAEILALTPAESICSSGT